MMKSVSCVDIWNECVDRLWEKFNLFLEEMFLLNGEWMFFFFIYLVIENYIMLIRLVNVVM